MIIIILPSKNESDNIANITRIVDRGLQTYFPQSKSLLLNVDSASSDRTSKIFLSTDTITSKKSIVLDKGHIGKGFNLKKGIEYGLEHESDYFITIDTDVKSADSSWIHSYLYELINNNADYVIPIYKRNKFEGNTTNHFSSPLVWACWNKNIQQPIAGDFAFRKKQAEVILNSFDIPTDYRYGVDTMMTWCMLSNNYKCDQINLDKKIHNPSFSKLPEMFKEVCFSSLYRINKFRNIIKKNITESAAIIVDTHVESDYCIPPKKKDVDLLSEAAERLLQNGNSDFLAKDVDLEIWTNCLVETIDMLLNQPATIEDIKNLVERISPVYYARVVNYIRQVENMNAHEISAHLNSQKRILATKLRSII